MYRWCAVAVVVAVLFSAQSARAYSALDEDDHGVSVGTGIVAGSSDIAFVISLTGMSDFVVWQIYDGGVAEATIAGASVDYILSGGPDHNEGTCGNDYWFGAGASGVVYKELFTDDAPGGAHKGGGAGVNIGGGVRSGRWGLDGYIHYFPGKHITAIQTMLTYDVE